MDDTSPPDDDLAVLDFFTPATESTVSDLDALGEYQPAADPGGDDPQDQGGTLDGTFTVTNPPGTVTVSAMMDGSVRRVDLSQQVTSMTEHDLADEIVVIARLATQEARAAQYEAMRDGMRTQGHDDFATREFLTRDLELPSPDEALAARMQVFATRYGGEE